MSASPMDAPSSNSLAPPLIVAHRGASRECPENTVASFNRGWDQGADAIEGDFRLTKDGHVVCVHDPDLKRVAGVPLVVADSCLQELRQVDVASRHSGVAGPCTIPTLDEVLATVPPQKLVYMEIKCGVEVISPLFEGIDGSALHDDQVVIISFDAEVLREVKVRRPQYKTYWLRSFRHDGEGATAEVLRGLDESGADGLSFGGRGASESLAKAVQARGYECHVWTIDDVAAAKRFLSWGVLSITTNVPGHMKNGLLP